MTEINCSSCGHTYTEKEGAYSGRAEYMEEFESLRRGYRVIVELWNCPNVIIEEGKQRRCDSSTPVVKERGLIGEII